MDPFFVKGAQLFLSLSILIVLHEFGHFIPARLFKIRVEKFFLFFDVKFALFKKKIGETVYGIGWLPLGGYVKIAGMIDESMDKEAMAQEPKPWEFRSKPAWQRLIVMIGGVTVNILLGFFIYIMIIANYGEEYTTADDLKYGFGFSPIMESYGFEQGDKILEINGEELLDQMDFPHLVMMRDVSQVKVLHNNGSTEVLTLPEDIGMKLFKSGEMPGVNAPRTPVVLDSVFSGAKEVGILGTDELISINEVPIEFKTDATYALQKKRDSIATVTVMRDGVAREFEVPIGDDKMVGVGFDFEDKDYVMPKRNKREYGLGESISRGINYGVDQLVDYAVQFKYVFTSKGASQVGGFGAIAGLFPDQWDWLSFWQTTAFISIILAFMNILPIPALDGGHVMFLLYEMITGRKPSDKFLEYAQMIGFFLLIALVLYANGNDIYRYFFE
ncbi:MULTISPECIES: RIP metalloprotease RseP [unclassified Leeuwenhoekiella]|uniref:RIP metalloprotease RseP n=1 Tax=unclassified Leeuwenhoekiella TaxID=2615029 RepID=UPI000C649E20|nr:MULTISPECIES: RIP metalloprotease RseP [unclassified Leeuwenhoekiella]MBA80133.1 RIP metalloprotease RseP [Leeuwenhoekiella sp.]|tara:strand:+ start:13893 stop:15224 length:1332 start_codon:yes stop_codon:yes gene_type:complete